MQSKLHHWNLEEQEHCPSVGWHFQTQSIQTRSDQHPQVALHNRDITRTSSPARTSPTCFYQKSEHQDRHSSLYLRTSCSVHLKCLQRKLLSMRIAVICTKKLNEIGSSQTRWNHLEIRLGLGKRRRCKYLIDRASSYGMSWIDYCHTRMRYTKSTLVHFLQTSRRMCGPWPSQAKTVHAATASSTFYCLGAPDSQTFLCLRIKSEIKKHQQKHIYSIFAIVCPSQRWGTCGLKGVPSST